ncbi:unnamed protein product [Moneuplotes crassus]|uniref:Uncharacterized protein n=1 Tax=Euplotes crassus TaxID=5936 RepID=A0AAD1XBH9_EUPCR|nr:unnamed protein product [Moneuplotes crassus]
MGSAASKEGEDTTKRTVLTVAGISALVAGGYICYRYGVFSRKNQVEQKEKIDQTKAEEVKDEEVNTKDVKREEAKVSQETAIKKEDKSKSSQGQGAPICDDPVVEVESEGELKTSTKKENEPIEEVKLDENFINMMKNFEATLTEPQKEYCEEECAKLIKELNKSKDGYVEELKHLSKDDILKMLKVTGRLGKSRSKLIRHKNQDTRANLVKSNPDAYFQYAVKSIIEEEGLYNESIDYVLQRVGVSQDDFFNIQSIYMNDSQFCEALTKIDMETLPLNEGGEEKQLEQIPKKACKNMLKQLYKDAEKIFDSLYKQKVEDTNMKELSPVLFETIANDLMFVKNGYRMDDVLRIASDCKLMNDKEFMDYIQKYQNKLLASIVQVDSQQPMNA